jgi:hypothetical protein
MFAMRRFILIKPLLAESRVDTHSEFFLFVPLPLHAKNEYVCVTSGRKGGGGGRRSGIITTQLSADVSLMFDIT